MIVSRTEYRRFTSDYSSYDGDVDEALANAQEQAEMVTGRKFDLGTHTEVLPVYDNLVYPSAFPTAITDGTIAGDSIDLGYFSSWSMFHEPSFYRTVTYTGGWTSETAPVALKKLVARLAAVALVKPSVDFSALPVGVTSVSVGDMSLSGKNLSTSSSSTPDAAILSELRKWRRPIL